MLMPLSERGKVAAKPLPIKAEDLPELPDTEEWRAVQDKIKALKSGLKQTNEGLSATKKDALARGQARDKKVKDLSYGTYLANVSSAPANAGNVSEKFSDDQSVAKLLARRARFKNQQVKQLEKTVSTISAEISRLEMKIYTYRSELAKKAKASTADAESTSTEPIISDSDLARIVGYEAKIVVKKALPKGDTIAEMAIAFDEPKNKAF